MNQDIQRISREWTKGKNQEQALRVIFERVRDIPYGVIGSRDPLKVYKAHKGTCSGKHFLLAALYRANGFEVKDMLAFHRYSELPRSIEYPEKLKDLLEKGEGIPDYHNFIKIFLKGDWLLVDATFEKSLKKYFVVNEWYGKDMKLTVKPVQIWETINPKDFKIAKLQKLPLKIQDYRIKFLNEFSHWLNLLREKDASELSG